jgi:sensor histidine kinase YesM
MKCETDSTIDDGSPGIETKPNFTINVVKAVGFICVVTLIIVVLFLSLGKMHLSDSGTHILFSFVYTSFIALPSMFILNWIGHRFTGAYPRAVYLFHALALLCIATLGCLAGALVLQFAGALPKAYYWPEIRSSLPFAMVASLIIGLVNAGYDTMHYKLRATALELQTRQLEHERANKLLVEARLSSLESRIAPHFLFNTLNSIAALIPRDPVRAEDTVGKLASLLRFSLNANHAGFVPLAQEIKIVRDYLEIERTRFGNRLNYSIEIPEHLNAVRTPPLALQSIVENVVKHVVAKRSEGATIRVTGTEQHDTVRLNVVDDGPGFSLQSISPEHGLGNLIARLELLFGDRGKLSVNRCDQTTVVSLEYPVS